MSHVDFYEVKGPRWELALCARVEAAWEAGQRVYLWAESEALARRFDELLWVFRDDSFVPHGLWQGQPSFDEPVAVGWKIGNPNRAACLAVACNPTPDQVAGFDRVIDLAPTDVADRVGPARIRFKAYVAAKHDVSFYKAMAGDR